MSKTGGKTGDIFYRPFPKRLERRVLCRCHNKGRTFSSVFSKDPESRLFKQSLKKNFGGPSAPGLSPGSSTVVMYRTKGETLWHIRIKIWRKNTKFVNFAISVKIVKYAGPLWKGWKFGWIVLKPWPKIVNIVSFVVFARPSRKSFIL